MGMGVVSFGFLGWFNVVHDRDHTQLFVLTAQGRKKKKKTPWTFSGVSHSQLQTGYVKLCPEI